jgi:hypothetical protein
MITRFFTARRLKVQTVAKKTRILSKDVYSKFLNWIRLIASEYE